MEAPNFVLVTVDSLRADSCGYLNSKSDLTPTLDKMAEEGVGFENAIAPGPSTYECMPGVWTGEVMAPSGENADHQLAQMTADKEANMARETLPEWFNRHGYSCGAFTSNPHTADGSGFSRGFNEYEDFIESDEHPVMAWLGRRPHLSNLKHVVTTIRGERVARSWQSYYDRVRDWMESTEEPFFLWIFVLEPHTPYHPSREFRSGFSLDMYFQNARNMVADSDALGPNPERLRGWYEDAIRETDALLSQLREDVPDDTNLVVHSDHGEEFGELDHGRFGHEGHLYEENVHVPFVIDTDDFDRTVERPVSLADLPTILQSMAGGELTIPDREYVLSRTFWPNKIAVRTNRMKYIASLTADGRDVESATVFDLATDPKERNPIEAAPFAEIAEDIVRRRLSHEREVTAIRRTAETMETGSE